VALRLYLLHFQDRSALHAAFDRVLGCEDVASCSVEPEQARIRFLATRSVGEALVAEIYLDGGLRWCSRHGLGEVD
jgi:hypothetical protein